MRNSELRTVTSLENLKERIERFLGHKSSNTAPESQLALELLPLSEPYRRYDGPGSNVTEFLDFMTDVVPDGDLYLFGGVLRDFAFYGRKGFKSDIDLVVEGNWDGCRSFLEQHNAHRNKFGGYRLVVGGELVDIWCARHTWAVVQGHVAYTGISSLLETTVLNWDAILMNWRTRRIICSEDYLTMLQQRIMDVVLEHNPNPKGMAVRVFRHLGLKEAKSISLRAAVYMAKSARLYTYEQLVDYELTSYGDSYIDRALYSMFLEFGISGHDDYQKSWEHAGQVLQRDGISVLPKQQAFSLTVGR